MKTIINEGRPVSQPNSSTMFDDLPSPVPGRTIVSLSNSEIANALIALGVPGAAHTEGRAANLEHYSKHLDQVRAREGDAIVSKILGGAQ